jgi:cytochrome P450
MNPLRTPPGPKGHWLSGNLLEFRRDRLDFLTRCVREHGDIVKLRFAHRPIYLVSHPDLIEEVLVTHSKHFSKHFGLRMNPLVLGQGLLTSDGDFWRRQRRLIQPVFNRGRIMSYAPTMVAITERLIGTWKADETRDVHEEMMRLTLEIAAQTLFGAEVGSESHAVMDALAVLQNNFLERFNSLVPPPLWLPTRANLRMRRAIRQLDTLLYRIISQRRESKEDRGDLLSLLLRARDEDDGSGMTDRQVRDEAMTLFLAGHETTALSLSWAWYLLARDEGAQVKLTREVDEVLAGRLPMVADWPRLKYTEMVALEAMRLYPPAYVIGREATADCAIGGYFVPRKMTILMPQWCVQRDPRFFEAPDSFRPERWGEAKIQSLPKFAYFPFGGGPRLCIGNTFAMMEMVLVLATIARKFHFRMQPGATVTPLPTFTLRPVPGVPGVIVPRLGNTTTATRMIP